ncbi:MAG TPA: hypothetical protein VH253_14500 [Phycisphaerae bacterium]|nr:hypothetical protein [Phycisphaerae bacterium]
MNAPPLPTPPPQIAPPLPASLNDPDFARGPDSISLRFTPTADDFHHVARDRRRIRLRRAAPMLILLAAALLWLIGDSAASVDTRIFTMPWPKSINDAVTALVFAGAATSGIWIPALALCVMIIVVRRWVRTAAIRGLARWTAQEQVEIHASPAGLDLRTALSHHHYPWSAFFRFNQTPTSLLFWLNALLPVPIPRRGNDPAALDALAAWWRQHHADAPPPPLPLTAAPGDYELIFEVTRSDYARALRLHPTVRSRRQFIWIAMACLCAYSVVSWTVQLILIVANGQPFPSPLTPEGLAFHLQLLTGLLVLALPPVAKLFTTWLGWRIVGPRFAGRHFCLLSDRGITCRAPASWNHFEWKTFSQAFWGPQIIILAMVDGLMVMLPTRAIPPQHRESVDQLIRNHVGEGIPAFPITPR